MSERQGRDISDPLHLGRVLLQLRKGHPELKLSAVADTIAPEMLKPYKDDRTHHSVKYMQELKQRAADGDKYAISALARMNGQP